MAETELLKELVGFLHPSQRGDVKTVALTHVLGLTGSAEGKETILGFDPVLTALFSLTCDQNHKIAKDALLCLINLSVEEVSALKMYETAMQAEPKFYILNVAVQNIIDENSEIADPWSMVLSNLTRSESVAYQLLDMLDENEKLLPSLTKSFTKLDYNKKAKLHFMAQIFCNLTQLSRGRELFYNSKYDLLENILPFVSYGESVVRRSGAVGIIKNLCFDPVYHSKFFDENDDILYAILYPLCGPEEFSDEENEKFPLELQYLPESKTREEDPDLRKMLLESLLQLCATKRYRELLRAKGVYEILREYHKWEANVGENRECLLACENVVDILIKTEDEIGLDNYKHVDVPNDVAEKFKQDDLEYLKEEVK